MEGDREMEKKGMEGVGDGDGWRWEGTGGNGGLRTLTHNHVPNEHAYTCVTELHTCQMH